MTKPLYLFFIFLLFSCPLFAREHSSLSFVANKNQWDEQIRYRSDIPGGAVFLTNKGFTYNLFRSTDIERIHELKHKKRDVATEKVQFHAYRVSFEGSNPDVLITASDKKSFYHNYFLGNDPKKWASEVPIYNAVEYNNVYNGINARVYSQGTSMKYDFIVAPSADPSIIELSFVGVKPVLNTKGDLILKTTVGTITEKAPYTYQLVNGQKKQVTCSYKITENGHVKFAFPKGYDKTKELIIDPILVFATFSGSSATTFGFSATYDVSGCLYAGGEVFNVGWPVSLGAFQLTYGGAVDAGINKYSSSGSNLIYSTYYGGSSGDLPNNMIVNKDDQLIVTGSTRSSNLPVTTGCFDNSFNGGLADIYVARFSSNGAALLGATYMGGTDNDGNLNSSISVNYGDQNRGDLLVDNSGNIIVCASTASSDFPVTPGAFQSTYGGIQDGVVFKVDSNCSNVLFSTFLGGSGEDACFALAKTSTQDIVVVGGTESSNFPVTPGAVFTAYQGAVDGFVTILDPSGNSLVHSTYLGTNDYDHAFKVQVDPANDHVYVCGQTDGTYPVSPGVYSNTGGNIFIQELSDDLSTALLSTTIGDINSTLIPTAFLYDVCGNIYFCGFSASTGLPLTSNAHQSNQGGFWLSVLQPGMTGLLYASYMGGTGDHVDGGSSRFDPQGVVYHSVCTLNGFTSTPGSWQPVNLTSGYDVASFKFDFEVGTIEAVASVVGSDSVCVPGTIQFGNNSLSAKTYLWDFGDGSPTSTAVAPSHTYTTPGIYTVTLYAYRPTGCVTKDTFYLTVHAFKLEKPVVDVKDTAICKLEIVSFSASGSDPGVAGRKYHWEPVSAITTDPDQQTIMGDTRLSNTFTVTITDSIGTVCQESASGTITVTLKDPDNFLAFGDTSICRGDTATLWTSGGDYYSWEPFYNISDTVTPSVTVAPQENTTYSVLISDIYGCKKRRDVTVKIHPDVHLETSEDLYIKYGESTVIYATGAATYAWTPEYRILQSNAANPTVYPDVTTTYYVVGTSAEGCVASDSVTVKVTNVIIPTAFSPNGDGRNDIFTVRPTHSGVRVMDISVYNRWGERVFVTNLTGPGWDGTYKGIPAELGTYFFTVTYAIGKRQYTEKGDVTLIR